MVSCSVCHTSFMVCNYVTVRNYAVIFTASLPHIALSKAQEGSLWVSWSNVWPVSKFLCPAETDTQQRGWCKCPFRMGEITWQTSIAHRTLGNSSLIHATRHPSAQWPGTHQIFTFDDQERKKEQLVQVKHMFAKCCCVTWGYTFSFLLCEKVLRIIAT